eukprot:PhF_6_TR37467/c0_g1_i1/m.55162
MSQVCLYGEQCWNKDCTRAHPTPRNFCIFYQNCQHPSCPCLHPPVCVNGMGCRTRTTTCKFRHLNNPTQSPPLPCISKESCWNRDCKYGHPATRALCPTKDCVIPGCPLIHPPKCTFLPKCTAAHCVYRHMFPPPGRPAPAPDLLAPRPNPAPIPFSQPHTSPSSTQLGKPKYADPTPHTPNRASNPSRVLTPGVKGTPGIKGTPDVK